MNMLRFSGLLALFALTGAFDTSFSLRGAVDAMEKEERQMQQHRSLTILEALPCPVTGVPLSYFNVTFDFAVRADADPQACNSNVKLQIGNMVNDLLLKFGVGKEGSTDDIMFLAEVCPIPTTTTGSRRELQIGALSFRLAGGGACTFCAADNTDKRRQLWTLDPSKSWFNSVFKPFMEIALKLKFIFRIAPQFPQCFDQSARLNLTVQEVNMNPKTEC